MPRFPTEPDAPNSGTVAPGESPKDERGRSYVVWPDGSRYYLMPIATGGEHAGGMIHNPDKWNPKTGEWQSGGVNWSALGSWLALGAMGGYAGYVAAAGPAAVTATTAAAPAAAAPLAAAAPATTATGAAAIPAAAATGGAVVPAATAATGAGLGSLGWASLAAGVGSQAVGAYLQSRANNRATDAEAAANDKALDFTKEVYATERADSEPYRRLGASSANALSSWAGFPTAQQTAQAQQGKPLPADPTHIPPGQNFPSSWVPGSPFAPGGAQTQMVTMRKGNEVGQVAQKDVAHWQSLGAEVVNGPAANPAPTPATAPRAPSIGDFLTQRSA